MDIMNRIDIMKEYAIVDSKGYEDLIAIVRLLNDKFGFILTEENAGVLLTHIAAAFNRNNKGEDINPLAKAAVEELKENPFFEQSNEILNSICIVIQNELSLKERDFVLLHLCTMLYGLNKKNRKEEE